MILKLMKMIHHDQVQLPVSEHNNSKILNANNCYKILMNLKAVKVGWTVILFSILCHSYWLNIISDNINHGDTENNQLDVQRTPQRHATIAPGPVSIYWLLKYLSADYFSSILVYSCCINKCFYTCSTCQGILCQYISSQWKIWWWFCKEVKKGNIEVTYSSISRPR